MAYWFRLVFDLFIAFKTETCLNPAKWLATMFIRGCIFAIFCNYSDQFFTYFQMDRNETIGAAFYDLFLILPLVLFILWYFFTTLLLFLGVIYFTRTPHTLVQNDYNAIVRLLEWRDNKMQWSSYEEASQLMRDTAVLNNLTTTNPEAKRQLDFINNKLQFLSYNEGLDFLRGNKR